MFSNRTPMCSVAGI